MLDENHIISTKPLTHKEEKEKRKFEGGEEEKPIIKDQTFLNREIKVPIETKDIGYKKKIKVYKKYFEFDDPDDQEYIELFASDKPNRILKDIRGFYYISLKNRNGDYRWIYTKK